MRHVHSDKIERWLGSEAQRIVDATRDWYGPPIAVANVPGKVWATRGGEFIGHIDGGGFMSLAEAQWDRTQTVAKRI